MGLLDELRAAVLVRNVALGVRDFANFLSHAAIEGGKGGCLICGLTRRLLDRISGVLLASSATSSLPLYEVVSPGPGGSRATRVKLFSIFEKGQYWRKHQKPSPKRGPQMAYVIDCVDGMQVRGDTLDELRTNAEKHVAEYHKGEDLDFEAIMATAREE
jgi:hypothetical protein